MASLPCPDPDCCGDGYPDPQNPDSACLVCGGDGVVPARLIAVGALGPEVSCGGREIL